MPHPGRKSLASPQQVMLVGLRGQSQEESFLCPVHILSKITETAFAQNALATCAGMTTRLTNTTTIGYAIPAMTAP